MQPMSPERWRQVDALFDAALDRPETERAAFLRAECGDDAELLAAVEALLEADRAADAELDEPITRFAAPLLAALPGEDPEAARGGEQVGAYRLLHEIGRGGMGVVYLAERADAQFEKRVALKLVKRGMDTDEVLLRFRLERQILASLEHPNIARLLDGGATGDGRPYLVMEYVEGRPITEFCDERRLGVEERLDLFRTVCLAVDHAHRNLLIHRDLKPSNILVSDDGVPKLLDFGIAKLLDDASDDWTPRTRTGVRILTPEFASPEQLAGGPLTTSSDVYSLGLVLYELLTGRRPSSLAERRRGTALIEVEPPSTATLRVEADPAAGGAAQSPETRAALRGTTPARLRRRLHGDLDGILLRALAADPARRYASAEQLARDLARHRAGLPVHALAGSSRYRAGKFVRRHAVGLAAIAGIIASLAIGLGAALSQARRAGRERDVAQQERDKAQRVADFLSGLFQAANPEGPRERLDTLTVVAFLDRGAAALEHDTLAPAPIRGELLRVVGGAYRNLGAFDRAAPLVNQAVATLRGVPGDHDLPLAEALTDLGTLNGATGHPAEAEKAYREALTLRRARLATDDGKVALALSNVGASLQDQGKYADARPLYDSAIAMLRRLARPDTGALATVLNGRMNLAMLMEDRASAMALSREILDLDRGRFGDDHPTVARDLNNVAFLLALNGRYAEAESTYRQVLGVIRERYGPRHPNTATIIDNLASAVLKQHRLAEADSLYRVSLAMRRESLGPRHPALAMTLANHADVLVQMNRLPDAEREYRESIEIARKTLGPMHQGVGIPLGRLAAVRCREGDVAGAERMFDESLRVLRAAFPPDHPRIYESHSQHGRCLVRAGRYPDAEKLLLPAYDALRRRGGPAPLLGDLRANLAALYVAWGKPDRAAAYQDAPSATASTVRR